MKREPLWFEDFVPGTRWRTEGATVTEAQILDFAQRWDPQPFHMDVEAAKGSVYGGLIGSGFQTMLIAFRLWMAEKIVTPSAEGSPGMSEVRWFLPTRPGDTIHVEVEAVSARPSASRPAYGIVEWRYDVFNHTGARTMTWTAAVLHLKRPENRPDREATP
ncbi:MAG: MaoC family dehydratase [Paracoccaceae bacterium]